MRIIRGIAAILAVVALAGCGLGHSKDLERKEKLIAELSAIDGVDHVEVEFRATAGGLGSAPFPTVYGRDDLSPTQAEKVARRALARVPDLGVHAETARYRQRVHGGTIEVWYAFHYPELSFSPATFTSLFEELRRGASKAKYGNSNDACFVFAEGPSDTLSDWFDAPMPEGCKWSQRTWSTGGVEVRSQGGPLPLRVLAPIAEGGKVKSIDNDKRELSLYPADGVEPRQLAAEAAGVVADLPSGHGISIKSKTDGGSVVVEDGKVALKPGYQTEGSKQLVEAINAHL